jgi:hypothetical protein
VYHLQQPKTVMSVFTESLVKVMGCSTFMRSLGGKLQSVD